MRMAGSLKHTYKWWYSMLILTFYCLHVVSKWFPFFWPHVFNTCPGTWKQTTTLKKTAYFWVETNVSALSGISLNKKKTRKTRGEEVFRWIRGLKVPRKELKRNSWWLNGLNGWRHWLHRYIRYLVGGFKYFLFSPRKLGKIPILTNIFKGVETTN